MRRVIIALMLGLLILSLPGCRDDGTSSSERKRTPGSQATWSDVEIGMSRERVKALLGEPSGTEILIKQTDSIWGPQEEWWHRVGMGDTLHTWLYEIPDEGSFAVFWNDSDTVSFTAFMPEGVVY